MLKKILKLTGEDVGTLYLAYKYSTKLNSTVNASQRRQIFKATLETYAKMSSTPSSSLFPSAAP